MQHLFHVDARSLVGSHLNSMLFQNNEGIRTTWGTGKIFKATSRGERLQRVRDYYVKTPAGYVEAEVDASPVASAEQEFSGAVITLRVAVTEEKPDMTDDLARAGRRHTRRRIGAVLRLFDRTTGMNLGRLLNVSMDGFKLSTRESLTIGRVYEVSMILPETLAGSNTLSFDAEPVWVRPAEDVPGEFRVGFRIVSLGPNDSKVLAHMIEKY